MISFKQLRYALAVEKNLHFRKAAEECAVSQSAMSSALLELERHLGFSLFERDNKRVLVTPIGKSVLATARQIQFHMDELHHFSDTSRQVLAYPMTLGIVPSACAYLLPKILPSVHRQYPGCELDIVEAHTDELLTRVRSGQLDAAIVALPYATEGLLQFEFYQDSLYWAVHDSHPYVLEISSDSHAIAPPLSQYVAADDIAKHELVLLDKDHCLYKHVDQALALSAQQANTRTATNLHTLLQLVIGRAGTTILPKVALEALVTEHTPIRVFELEQSKRSLAFVVRPNYPSLQNIEALKAILAEQFGKPN